MHKPSWQSFCPLKQEFARFDVRKKCSKPSGQALTPSPPNVQCPYENNTFQTGHMRINKKYFVFSTLDISEASNVRTKLQHSPTHINFTRVRRNFWSKHCTSEMLKICCLHILIIQSKNYLEMVLFSTCGLWPCASTSPPPPRSYLRNLWKFFSLNWIPGVWSWLNTCSHTKILCNTFAFLKISDG